jgi:hypothetical protein
MPIGMRLSGDSSTPMAPWLSRHMTGPDFGLALA